MEKPPAAKKFYENINDHIQRELRAVINEYPELDGAVVALAYAPEIGDPPACLVVANLQDPGLLCRLGVQTAKAMTVVARGVANSFSQAEVGLAKLQQAKDGRSENQDTEGAEETAPGGEGVGNTSRPHQPS